MSENMNDAKKGIGSPYPELVVDAASGPARVEPLLSPKKFKKRFFFGIPMHSPLTKEKIDDEDLEDLIKRAVNQFELDTKLDVHPVIRNIRLPFDPNLYHKNLWLEVPHKPIQKVIKLSITSAAYKKEEHLNDKYAVGDNIYTIPNEWIDVSHALRGNIFVNPLNPAFSAIGINTSAPASGAAIFVTLGQQSFIPAYWLLTASYGLCSEDGQLPVVVNECIGAKAAMMLIDNLLPIYAIANQSLNMDGLGQSVSNQTYQLLQVKREALEKEYMLNVGKLKVLTGNKIMVGNV